MLQPLNLSAKNLQALLLGATTVACAFPLMAQPQQERGQMPDVVINRQRNETKTVLPIEARKEFLHQLTLLKTPVNLKAGSWTLEAVAASINQSVPGLKKIDVRGARPVTVTFEADGLAASSILRSMASLAGCRYLALPTGVIIAPLSKLSRAELNRLSFLMGEDAIPSQVRFDELARELAQNPAGATTLGKLSLASQDTIQNLVNGLQTHTGPTLTPESSVALLREDTSRTVVINSPAAKHQYRFSYAAE